MRKWKKRGISPQANSPQVDPLLIEEAAKRGITLVDRPGFFTGAKRALEQGVTFGLRDEIGGAAAYTRQLIDNLFTDKPVDPNEAYSKRAGLYRDQLKGFEHQYPVTSTALEVLGGFGGVGPAQAAGAVAPKILSLGEQMLRGAGTGATFGGITGFGKAEGGLENRAGGAGTGAVVGGIVGGLTPPIVEGVTRLGKHIGGILGFRDPENVFMDKLLGAFKRDGVTPEDALAKLNNWQMQGSKPEMLFELGGENVKGLARSISGVPGEAKNLAIQRLQARQEGQGARIASDVDTAFGRGQPVSYYGSTEALQKARSTQAQPLYDEAFNTVKGVHDDRIAEFLKEPKVLEGLKKGLTTQRLEALAEGRKFDPLDYAVTGFNEAGDPILGKVPNLRLLDAAKRGMDEIIEGFRDPTSGRINHTQYSRAVDAVRKSFVSHIDDVLESRGTDVYKAARAAWSGPSQSLDALRAGRSIFNKDPELTEAAISRLSPSDKEFFRAGAMRAAKDIVDRTPDAGDVSKRLFGNERIRKQLQATFDNANDWMKFQGAMNRELSMFKNAFDVSPRSGSQTAQRLSEGQDLIDNPAVRFGTEVAQGRGAGSALLNALAGPKTMSQIQQLGPRARQLGANAMFTETPQAATNTLQDLIAFRQQKLGRQLNVSELLQLLSGPLGAGSVQMTR